MPRMLSGRALPGTRDTVALLPSTEDKFREPFWDKCPVLFLRVSVPVNHVTFPRQTKNNSSVVEDRGLLGRKYRTHVYQYRNCTLWPGICVTEDSAMTMKEADN